MNKKRNVLKEILIDNNSQIIGIGIIGVGIIGAFFLITLFYNWCWKIY